MIKTNIFKNTEDLKDKANAKTTEIKIIQRSRSGVAFLTSP